MAAVPAAPWSDLSTSKKFRLGTTKKDVAGNEYMYVQGVASGALYDWVTIDEDFVTTRAIANGQGIVGILQSTLDATTDFGWAAISGSHYGKALTSFVDNGVVYLTGTAGSVDDTDVAGDQVYGAIGRSAVDAVISGVAEFQLYRPEVLDAGN